MRRNGQKLIPTLFFVFALSGAALAQSLNLVLPGPQDYVPPAGSPAAKYGKLSVSGSKIKGDNFTGDVQLRGMSLFWSNSGPGSPFYNEDVIAWLVHDWKVDLVRAAMGVEATIEGCGEQPPSYGGGGQAGYLGNPANKTRVETVVKAAIMRGIYVIIDWHSHCAQNNTQGAAAFFGEMAEKYGKYPNVIFEIYNEPTTDWGTIKTYSNSVVPAIRNAGSDNIIIIGTPSHSSRPDAPVSGGAVTGSNLAYSFHFYNDDWHWNNYRTYLTNALNGGYAVFVSEWGTSAADGNGSFNESRSNEWLSILDQNKVSWANWSVTNANEASAALKTNSLSGWDPATDLSSSGAYLRTKLRAAGGGVTNSTYAINTSVPGGGGTLSKSSPGPHGFGDKVLLKAVPDPGYEFRNWGGDLTGSARDSVEITVRGINLNVEASFYRSGLITNGRFNGLQPWQQYQSPFTAGDAQTPKTENSEFNTAILGQSTNPEHLYLWQNNLPLERGKGYRLSFRAWADSPRKIAVSVSGSSARTTKYMPAREIVLNAEPKDYTIDFVVPEGDGANVTARVEFWYGVCATNWSMTAVSLIEGDYQDGGGDGVNFNGDTSDWDSPSSITPRRTAAAKTVWSLVRVGGGFQLKGPAQGGGAKVFLYDIRGRVVKSVSISDGKPFTLSTTAVPAGNYLLAVKNSQGKDVYSTRVLLAK